jgi:hypothetical protein
MKATYFDDDDTLVIHLSEKPITREVSRWAVRDLNPGPKDYESKYPK